MGNHRRSLIESERPERNDREVVLCKMKTDYDPAEDADKPEGERGGTVIVLEQNSAREWEDTEEEIPRVFHWSENPPLLTEGTRVWVMLAGPNTPEHLFWIWDC